MTDNQTFEDFRTQLGKRVQELRKQKGLTQEDLASKTNLERVYVGYIEQGIRSASLESLFAVATALNVEVSELFKISETTA